MSILKKADYIESERILKRNGFINPLESEVLLYMVTRDADLIYRIAEASEASTYYIAKELELDIHSPEFKLLSQKARRHAMENVFIYVAEAKAKYPGSTVSIDVSNRLIVSETEQRLHQLEAQGIHADNLINNLDKLYPIRIETFK